MADVEEIIVRKIGVERQVNQTLVSDKHRGMQVLVCASENRKRPGAGPGKLDARGEGGGGRDRKQKAGTPPRLNHQTEEPDIRQTSAATARQACFSSLGQSAILSTLASPRVPLAQITATPKGFSFRSRYRISAQYLQ